MFLHHALSVTSLALLLLCSAPMNNKVDAFQSSITSSTSTRTRMGAVQRPTFFTSSKSSSLVTSTSLKNQQNDNNDTNDNNLTRRSMFINTTKKVFSTSLLLNAASMMSTSNAANAAVGSLAEFNDSNAYVQGITINVSDLEQQNSMVEFLREGFQFKLLRQRKVGSVTETWLGFGPEELKIPQDFEMPVSSFAYYGGHASICIKYDSQTIDLYYRKNDESVYGDSNNIAYVQVGVPEYRISQMVKNGGNIMDAYGFVNVISPVGLPMRGIIGISPDPLMFVALYCKNVKETKEYYEQLGFAEQEYPYSRPNKGMGQFEPVQPKNSVYMSPSKNSMGVLLLPTKKRKIRTNPAFNSLNIVYTPSEGADNNSADVMRVADPSGVGITFKPYDVFEKEEVSTRFVFKEPQAESQTKVNLADKVTEAIAESKADSSI